jgi:2-polyprenyl-6-methoxyphenol hydroxylase-like FAD-dependent oxidoreductase
MCGCDDSRSVFSRLLPSQLYDVLPVLFPGPHGGVAGADVPPLVTGVSGPRLHFPLQVVHGTEYVSHRVALIGDSAHTIHPLAGQGVNLGFGDAQELARTVARAVTTGHDIGSVPLLREYERERLLQNTRMLTGVHTIKQMFGTNEGPFAALRSIGLDLFNSIPAIKNEASRVAMGLK